ncbi:MAG TPA: GTPase ObgE [Longimicrobiaceae bacterium]|nr:GTPase ObgE [Longimicrobiaceae bacterium]
MFLDQAKIQVKAGSGGDGVASFRRESKVPHGGPDGGDGGDGGDIVLRVDPQLSTLLDYRYRQQYNADKGKDGSGSNKTGRSGADLQLSVPPGTVVRDVETGEFLGELIEPGDALTVARGGDGGRGNQHFATATNQAPSRFEHGRPGEEREIELELKLIADVGLVGEPNAGKSTFLATVSEATPKIADYPFTTLTPNLGVIQLSDARSFVVADIPGIIEGAHEGKGLGLQFLRHIERTRTLAVMIPADTLEPQAEYERLRTELRNYSPELADKSHCVIFTKSDLLPPDWPEPQVDAPNAWAQFVISSVAHKGLDRVLQDLWSHAATVADEDLAVAPESIPPWTP